MRMAAIDGTVGLPRFNAHNFRGGPTKVFRSFVRERDLEGFGLAFAPLRIKAIRGDRQSQHEYRKPDYF